MNICVRWSMLLLLCTCGWTLTGQAEQRPAPRGELRIVDKRWSNRWSIEHHVIEPLVELGPNGTLVPRLAIAAQMERHTRDQASFLLLYSPLQLYAVNKEVNFAPHPSGLLWLSTTSVTDQHWSVRDGQKGAEEMQGSMPSGGR